ncbi:hypothetical protein WQ54_18740 [Bacillus sp. SA1-12]|nr:hypothetical protein WQ54_18740 [Bacillus sp. SA1-12]
MFAIKIQRTSVEKIKGNFFFIDIGLPPLPFIPNEKIHKLEFPNIFVLNHLINKKAALHSCNTAFIQSYFLLLMAILLPDQLRDCNIS